MIVQGENYKGIEFVRISTLPEDQKQLIWSTIKRDKIIKILKSDCLLNDCVQVRDYQTWYIENFKPAPPDITETVAQPHKQPEYKLAYK